MAIKDYSTTASRNTALFPEGMSPASVNNSARQVQADVREFYETPQWRDLGHTVTYASTTTFTISGDKTAQYIATQRIRCYGTIMGTLYGSIVSSSYLAPNTTVTVTLDSGSLTSNLSAVALGLDPTNDPVPYTALKGVAVGPTEIDKTVITGQTGVAAAADDYLLGSDTSDSGNLKKFTVQSVADKAGLSGSLAISGTSTEAGYITVAEDTDNGTNKVKVQAPASIASDYTVTLPAAAGTLATTADVLAAFNGTKVYQTTGTSVTIGTWTTLLFDTESWDDAGWHSTSSNTDRITFDFTGRVAINGSFSPNTPNNASYGVRALKNGTVIARNFSRTSDPATENLQISVSCEVDVTSGDYVQLQGFNSNGTLTSATGVSGTSFSARRIK